MGSIAYVDSLALFKQLPAKLTLISISTEFVLRCAWCALICVGLSIPQVSSMNARSLLHHRPVHRSRNVASTAELHIPNTGAFVWALNMQSAL